MKIFLIISLSILQIFAQICPNSTSSCTDCLSQSSNSSSCGWCYDSYPSGQCNNGASCFTFIRPSPNIPKTCQTVSNCLGALTACNCLSGTNVGNCKWCKLTTRNTCLPSSGPGLYCFYDVATYNANAASGASCSTSTGIQWWVWLIIIFGILFCLGIISTVVRLCRLRYSGGYYTPTYTSYAPPTRQVIVVLDPN